MKHILIHLAMLAMLAGSLSAQTKLTYRRSPNQQSFMPGLVASRAGEERVTYKHFLQVNGAASDSILVFLNPHPSSRDFLGWAQAAFNNSVVIGAPGNHVGSSWAGAAYVMDVTNGYQCLPPLLSPKPKEGDRFGAAVDYKGNLIVVGAPGVDLEKVPNAGAAYLFNAGSGKLLCTLTSPQPDTSDGFGHAVAILGNHVLIGAPFSDTGGRDAGVVYLFFFDGNNCTLVQTFDNPSPEAKDQFGYSLTATPNDAIIGAPGDDAAAKDAGAVYLFNLTGGNLRQIVSPDSNSAFASFGFAVTALSNDVIVGAPRASVNAPNSGVAYRFDRNGALLATFKNPHPGLLDLFGWSVTASGARVVVGAPYQEIDGVLSSGAAYIFSAYNGALVQTLQKPIPSSVDGFGAALAIANNKILVGTPNDDATTLDAGSVYRFRTRISDPARLELPMTNGLPGETLTIPIMVSSKYYSLRVAQFVVDYDSNAVKLVGAEPGSATSGFQFFWNNKLPFSAISPGTNSNVLLQLFGAGGQSFAGEKQEVARLKFVVVGALGRKTPLAFDPVSNRTFLTDTYGSNLNGDLLDFNNGMLSVSSLLSVAGTARYCGTGRPVAGAKVLLYHPNNTFVDSTDVDGEYAFGNLPQNFVRLLAMKTGDSSGVITPSDWIKILRHIRFEDTLNACQRQAADVFYPLGVIDGSDAVVLEYFLAYKNPEPWLISMIGKWIVMPSDSSFALSANTMMDIELSLRGDVNLSWGERANNVLAKNASAKMARVALPVLKRESPGSVGDTLSIPIKVSTDSALVFVQAVIEHDSTKLKFVDAKPGRDAAGFSLLVNNKLPFTPKGAGTNTNVLVQATNIAQPLVGKNQEIAIIRMAVIGTAASESPLVLDFAPGHGWLTTANDYDFNHGEVELTHGKVMFAGSSSEDQMSGVNLPQAYELSPNHPNPFNPETTISYAIPTSVAGQIHVTLRIYNLQGQLVRTLVDGQKSAGRYSVVWDGRNDKSIFAPSGMYFYTITAGGAFKATRKMVILK